MSGKRKRIKSASPEKTEGRIPPATLPERKIKFSFEFYDITRDDYCLSQWASSEIKTSLERLKVISTKTYQELSEQRSWHFHEVDWAKTTERQGFPDPKANEMRPWQFAIPGLNNQARVFAAYSENVMFIVWFDLHHKILPWQPRNT